MNRPGFWGFLGFLVFLIGCGPDHGSKTELSGLAEDLWGNTIDLADYATGVTLIQPFSPANCGYCLIDGQFIARNYLTQVEERGGAGFHQCLFNPQLDVYAFLKHYREPDSTTLAFPPHLHRYHRDGFPFLIAFKDGHKVFAGPVGDYENRFLSLSKKLWPDSTPTVVLSGSLKMATNFIHENQAGLSIAVAPDGKEGILEQLQLKASHQPSRFAVPAKYQSELTAEDLALNLYFVGLAKDFDLSAFSGDDSPVHFEDDTVSLGPYRFPSATTALRLCLPNPHNKQRYVYLELPSQDGKFPPFKGWLDFVVSGKSSENSDLEIMLEGVFAKGEGNDWSWNEATVNRHPSLEKFCVGGVCPAPVVSANGEVIRTEKPIVPSPRKVPAGHNWILGSQACRFPDLAIDGDDNCWVTWEENGDILLALVSDRTGTQNSMVVEGTSADSYNPVLAWDGNQVWVVYVHENKEFYRIFGRYWDGRRLSAPIPISDNVLTDAITPAVTGDDKGRLVVAWAEWRANLRHLMTRTIDKGVRQPVNEVDIVPSDIDYTNAWYPSLAADHQGRFFGAWNQHYPASLGVCSGDLEEQAASVTTIYGSIDDNENGGYPDIAITDDGQRWVVWETFGWDVLSGESQFILASRFDTETGTWLQPEAVSDPVISTFCQTPQILALSDGRLCVIWSGRPAPGSADSDFGKWGVFMSVRDQDIWSPPRMLSKEGDTARAPRADLDSAGLLWVTWHTGTGDEMRVEVLRVSASIHR